MVTQRNEDYEETRDHKKIIKLYTVDHNETRDHQETGDHNETRDYKETRDQKETRD